MTKIDQEQEIINLASIANAGLWSTPHEKQKVLIDKFGSKEKAMQETFFLLVRGIKKALNFSF